MSSKIVYIKTARTGGGTNALDGVDGGVLNDGDVAFVYEGGMKYEYILDDDSGAAEVDPGVIAPDTNGGDKRWILQGLPSLFDANTILAADTDDTPAALTVAESTIVGRSAGGTIAALAASAVRTIIDFYTQAQVAINSIFGSDGKADKEIDLDGNVLSNPADPSAGTQVGGRDYNDARYALQTLLKLDHNVETLEAAKTLVITDLPVQKLDPDGASRDVTLPAEGDSMDLVFLVRNMADAAAENLVIKDDTPATLATIPPGNAALCVCDGTTWTVQVLFPPGVLYDEQSGAVTFPGAVVIGDYTLDSDAIAELYGSRYGVTYNETDDAYTRTGALAGEAVGASPGNDQLPIQRNMRRCVVDDSGVVQYYLDPDVSYNKRGDSPTVTGTDDAGTANKVSDTGVFTEAASAYVGKYVHNTTDDTYALITAKDSDDVLSIDADIMASAETFEICTAVLDGTDGQVMVEIPKFYFRYDWSDPVHTWEISNVQLPGFDVHPAFVKAGAEVDVRYIGAFESYKDGSNVLSSESGRSPAVSATRANFRTYATARGTGWHQLDFYLVAAVQLLYLTEYADFDSQAMIGNGNTEYASWPGSPPSKTGLSNGDGNGTGNASTAGGAATDYMSYRGIENLYGHIWKFVDGINVHNSTANGSRAYVAQDWQDFADDTDTDYDLVTSELAQTDGYARNLCPVEHGFLPKSVSGGSSSTGLADYYYTYYNDDPDSGWRVCLLGGNARNGSQAGAFCWSSNYASSFSSSAIGGRLCF